MENLDGRKAELIGNLTKGLDAYQRQWLDEIAVRDDTINETQSRLREAQITARKDARRIAALEREVAYLRAPVEYEDEATQTTLLNTARKSLPLESHIVLAHEDTCSGMVTREKFKQLQQRHVCLEQDYGKVLSAHKILAERFRKAQKILQAWQAYYDERSSEHEKHMTRKNAHKSRVDCSNQVNDFIRGSSAPASVSSVGQAGLSSIQDVVLPTRSTVAECSRGGSYDKIIPQSLGSMGEHSHDFTSGLENDKVVASGQTDDDLREQSGEKERGSLQFTAVPERGEDSSPILLSTRAVKRKRYRETSPTNPTPRIHQLDETFPGTAEKPVHIKSDQSSSSPLAVVRSHSLDEHDSMDLDEVGSKTPTPRKRRRTDSVPLPFAMCWPPSPTNGQEAVSSQAAENYTIPGQVNQRSVQELLRSPSRPSTLHQETCRRQEEYTTLLQSQHEKCGQREDLRKGEGPRIPQHIEDKPRRKQSFLFNQEVRHKRAQEKTKNSVLSPNTKSTNVVPTPEVHHDQCTGPGLATPETYLGFTGPKKKSNSNGDVKPQTNNAPILRSTDPNILPRTSVLSGKRTPLSSHRNRGDAPVHVLAEDGENEAKKPHPKSSKVSRAPKAEERLGSLLAQPRPDKPILPPETPGDKGRSSAQGFTSMTLDGQIDFQTSSKTIVLGSNSAAAEDRRKQSKQNIAGHQAKKLVPNSISTSSDQLGAIKYANPTSLKSLSPGKMAAFPQKDPIRTWPKANLRREHFKPNPSHSSGYSYASREVIRKHDERRCLPGCTRPDCCGDMLRKILAIGGPIVPNRSTLSPSTREGPQKDRAVDHSLLKDYMGDNYHNWRKMTAKEKDNEWDKAQQWDFGKRYGRHKDTGRQSTPPGYWQVDMATTQEKEKQDEEAELMEREVVEVRWREAMRKGGAWVFADE